MTTEQPPTFREVGVEEAKRLRDAGYRVIDVREPVEWDEGHLPGATLIPLADVASRIESEVPDRDTPLLVHCLSGLRSARASKTLNELGYRTVVNLKAHLNEWRMAGGAWEEPTPLLSPEQRRRYSRQVLIPEVGQEGQRKLLDSKVLLIGAGGLGSPIALYLTASGVGTIGLVDDDVVDESNLQRQVLHGTDRVGMKKVDSAELTLRGLNPETRVIKHEERLGADNVERLIGDYDVIVDGTDNFDTRYVLNDAAVKLRKPVVHGSIYRWDGQVTTFIPFAGPCYRCMYPDPAPARAGARLRRGRRARGAAGDRRPAAGQRGLQAAARNRRDPGRPAAAVRRGRHHLRRGPHLARSGLPGLRRRIDPPRDVGGRGRGGARGTGAMSTIRIPPVLRENTGGSRELVADGGTVSEALDDVFARFPALRERVTEGGQLSQFINVYVNGRDVRYAEGLATSVGEADTIILLPAMAGG